jgi:uncharacterized protein
MATLFTPVDAAAPTSASMSAPAKDLADATAPGQPATPGAGAPWWRFGLVWMVWGGPAVVVVASFITLALALMIPDPVVSQEQSDANRTAAHQARNHAATGSVVPSKTGAR